MLFTRASHSGSSAAMSEIEDMVVLDAIARNARTIQVFTLDTGRLPEETQALLESARDRYPIPISTYFPDASLVQAWVEQNGPNAFYKSIAQRQQCCHVRDRRYGRSGCDRKKRTNHPGIHSRHRATSRRNTGSTGVGS